MGINNIEKLIVIIPEEQEELDEKNAEEEPCWELVNGEWFRVWPNYL